MKPINKWIFFGTFIFLVIVVVVSSYFYSIYLSFKKVYTEEIFEPLFHEYNSTASPYRAEPVSIEMKDPILILLLGVDQREYDIGRSDTIVLLLLNPKLGKSLMFNIPRDTRTEIVGRGTLDKINHAYAFGGVKMSVQTVENFLEIPIDYYVKINMEGFIEIIDTLGGVDIENPFSFTSWYEFPQGDLLLDGEHALDYVRMRYGDPRGDIGRSERQRKVLKAMIKKGTSPTILTKLDKILEQSGSHIKTNIPFDEVHNLITDYKESLTEIEEIEINGQGQLIDSIYYYVVSKEERERIRTVVNDYLVAP